MHFWHLSFLLDGAAGSPLRWKDIKTLSRHPSIHPGIHPSIQEHKLYTLIKLCEKLKSRAHHLECSIRKCTFWNKQQQKNNDWFQEVKNWLLCGNNCPPSSREGNLGICPFPSWNSLALKELLGKMWSFIVRSVHSGLVFFFSGNADRVFLERNETTKKHILVWRLLRAQSPHEKGDWDSLSPTSVFSMTAVFSMRLWTFSDAQKLSGVGFLTHHSMFYPLYSL